jgi:pimeloyl-ACP methyl ester carboxylesterase
MRRRFPTAAVLAAACILTLSSGVAHASPLKWERCSEAPGFECARADVPRDYARPSAGDFRLAVTRLPAQDRAHRIGSLFVNFGGPGSNDVATLQNNGKRLFATLNRRFDIVSFDPRGVGDSQPAVDCAVDQEAAGPFSQPFMTPSTVDPRALVAADRDYVDRCARRNPDVLRYVSTANVARDLDHLRQVVGDRRLSYLGLSYGTYLGATYASLFPHRYRALALEGALDPDRYANHPMALRASLMAGQERALGRFLGACAADQQACSGFGGADPAAALDALIERLDAQPLAAGSRTLDGDDVRVALGGGLHSKSRWGLLAGGLAAAEHGDGSVLRELADGFYGRRPDGSYRPLLDQFFAVSAADQRNPRGVRPYLRAGAFAWGAFAHSYFLGGYSEHAWGMNPVRPRGVFRGPFRADRDAPTTLVIGTTYDPATPYEGALALTRQLGNARLLTMDGDGHGAYGGESKCIDTAVNAYLERAALPARGQRCRQETPFERVGAPANVNGAG